MSSSDPQNITILGAGIIGLTSSLVLSHAYPHSTITIIAKHFPGDRSIEYTSPWAGANWSSMANDNGPLEKYDEVTFKRFGEIMDGKSVHGCQVVKKGEGNEAGLGRQGMWAVLDAPIEETNLLTPETGRIWYDELVGGLRDLTKEELPEGAVFGLEFPSTFRINTQVYLQWYVSRSSCFYGSEDERLEDANRAQAAVPGPQQRHQARAPAALIHIRAPHYSSNYKSGAQRNRSRLSQARRCQRHQRLSHARPDRAGRRAENANQQNVRI